MWIDYHFLIEEKDNQEIITLILSCLRLDVDITELHSWITRAEAVLQSPEFAIYRKEGNFSDLKEKVDVGYALIILCIFLSFADCKLYALCSLILLELKRLKQYKIILLSISLNMF